MLPYNLTDCGHSHPWHFIQCFLKNWICPILYTRPHLGHVKFLSSGASLSCGVLPDDCVSSLTNNTCSWIFGDIFSARSSGEPVLFVCYKSVKTNRFLWLVRSTQSYNCSRALYLQVIYLKCSRYIYAYIHTQYIYVVVPGRNRTLFCCIFRLHYCVQSTQAQNFR